MTGWKTRLSKVRAELAKRRLDAGILNSWNSLYYLTGMRPIQARSGSFDPMPLLVSPDKKEPVFVPTEAFSKAVELEHKNVKDVRPCDGPEKWSKVADVLREWGLSEGRIGIEAQYLSSTHMEMLRQKVPRAKFEDSTDIVEKLRMIKDPEELAFMRKAAWITDKVVETIAKDILRPGVTELYVAGEIVRSCIEYGAEDASFHPQVFSGRRGFLLNVSSSEKKLEKGELVMLDFGANVAGYRTDTTRCFVLGKALAKHKEASNIALKITTNAIDSIRPGVKASAIHRRALTDFRRFGYSGYCRHYTGHGLGLSTWEKPLLREFDHTRLEQNMVIAVEQGLYFPDFGVRWEENLIITKNGTQNLFRFPTELVELDF